MNVAPDVKQMEENLKQYPQQEVDRIMIRADKYLKYATAKKTGKRQSKLVSLTLMVLIENRKAVEEYKRTHSRTYPQRLTRWMHFKKAVWK